MIKRQRYLEQIIPLMDKPLIKVITGVRRSGKTVLLLQLQDYLRERGVPEEQLIYFSFESKMTKKRFASADALYEHLLFICQSLRGARAYIFLDEIQMLDGWEEVVSSLLIDVPCDITITGSNAKLLSGELATLLAGRYVQIFVYPFTLSEAKEISIQNGSFQSNEALFQDYLKYGGLPLRFSLEEVSIESYLSDTYDAIVVKDIVRRSKIKNANLLNRILVFLMDNIANPYSIRSITAALERDGIETTARTVSSYVDRITEAMVMYAAKRYDIKGKKLLQTNEKFFTVDLGLRNAVKMSNEMDYSKLYENIVYLELLYRGYHVAVGKTDEYEVDFVAYRGKEKIYVQVCYALASEQTIQREFGNLERIKDHHPKYVISGDLPDFSRDGIRHYNIIDFLLDGR